MSSGGSGGAVQQGGFNLGFDDITLGDKTTATEGSVIGSGSATTAGGDVIKDVDGPVIAFPFRNSSQCRT